MTILRRKVRLHCKKCGIYFLKRTMVLDGYAGKHSCGAWCYPVWEGLAPLDPDEHRIEHF